ncbi:MAG: hypothetical protein P4M12_12840 [Gammaproteobacteria bacterium]|nr:hypothetical protein [Gammaproteobacteria bacterium]
MVNIKDLPKARVVMELFKNVYRKSAASENEYQLISAKCHNEGCIPPLGIYSLEEDEVKSVLEMNLYIHNIGAVIFEMDFSNNEIDETHYEKIHEIKMNADIVSVQVCVDNLKKILLEEERKLQEQEASLDEKIMKKDEVVLLLRKLLEYDELDLFEADNGYSVGVLDYTELEQFKKIFYRMGLEVKYEKPVSVFEGLFTVPGEIILPYDLETLFKKLKEASLKQSSYGCAIM